MRLEYTAKRRVIATHTVGTDYEIAGPHEDALPQDRVTRTDSDAWDGSHESDTRHFKVRYAVSTDTIDLDDIPLWREFLTSVMGGESFIFDPDSDVATVVVNPLDVRMISKSVRPRRLGARTFRYNFVVEELI